MSSRWFGPRSVSLRVATVAALLAAFALLGLGQYAGAWRTYRATVEDTERHDELLRARHVQALFGAAVAELKQTSWDNGTWDEAYAFVEGHNPHFVDQYFSASVYDTHQIDALAVVSKDLSLLGARGFDRVHHGIVDAPDGLAEALKANGLIARLFRSREASGGYVRLAGRIYVVGTSPVLHNGARGESAGWLVLLRRIDKAYLDYVAERTGATVELSIAPEADGGMSVAAMPLSASDLSFDRPGNERISTRYVLGRVGSDSLLEVRLTVVRALYAAAMADARQLLISTLLTGAIASLLAVWVIDRRLLLPLRQISGRLKAIGERTRLSDRLPESGRADEIGELTHTVNGMLAQIEVHEDETQRSRDSAVMASRIKSEFVARMSHEIRTPMNGVLGMTELLQRTELNDRQRKFCETIHRSATSLLEIVNDILDFSKMEAGRLLLHRATFALQETVEDVAELLAPRAHARGTELVVAVDPDVPAHIVSDRVRLTQILTNLIGNAIKFTEAGQIDVRVRVAERRTNEIRIEFAVRDTGVGISAAACGTLFEAFTQADNSEESSVKGTGLGLAIARQLVELMGGTIGVTSEVGVGSTFTFSIVAGVPEQASPGLVADLLYGRRVLVADDNTTAAAVLGATLRRVGATVDVVSNVESLCATLDTAPGGSYELLLIDHALREPEVLARLEHLRATSTTRLPRVVLLSPVQSGGPGLLAELDSIDAYLTKPVRQTLLVSTAARLLGVRALAAVPDPMATGEFAVHRRLLGLKVLVVEDNPVNRDVAIGMLNALGCTARTACDGEQALSQLDREDFEVILMDRQMPRLDGIATTLELRRRESARRRPPTPVIALTAHAMPGSKEECLRAGMNDFLLKPFTLSELSRVLARYARRRSEPARPAVVAVAPAETSRVATL